VFYKANEDISYMDYEAEECDSGLHAFFHDMTQIELQDNWARCWCVSVCYSLLCLLHHGCAKQRVHVYHMSNFSWKVGNDSTEALRQSAFSCAMPLQLFHKASGPESCVYSTQGSNIDELVLLMC